MAEETTTTTKTESTPAPTPTAPNPDLSGELIAARAAVKDATEAVTAATEAARAALKTANPDLPPTAFEGADVNAIQTGLARARDIANFSVKAFQDAQPKGATTPVAAGAARTPAVVPAKAFGVSKIAFALNNPGPGSTE